MTKQPDEIRDDEGKWAKRSVFVAEFVEEEDVDPDRMEGILDEMIEDGPMRSKEIGDVEYVQLEGGLTPYKAMAKYKANSARGRINRFVRGG